MGKKRRAPVPSPAEQFVAEIDRRIDQAMAHAADSFSDRVSAYYDGKAAGLRELRDWVTG